MSYTSAVFKNPHNSAKTGQNNSFTDMTAVSLASTDWTADTYIPRGFHANADGTLQITLCGSDTSVPVYVNKGSYYPYAIRKITQASCSAALQIANAVILGF